MSAKERQPGSGGDLEGTGAPGSFAREGKDMIGLVKRAPEGALLVREVPPVEEALKRAQAPVPAQAPRRDVVWESGGSPSREPQQVNTSF